jgi:3-deoxy-D-manno-octulosonic acid (KDO) 8-phosphate synthase
VQGASHGSGGKCAYHAALAKALVAVNRAGVDIAAHPCGSWATGRRRDGPDGLRESLALAGIFRGAKSATLILPQS